MLIEHDMDVALTVAERVTMMHNGRVIVEGTPTRSGATPLVHVSTSAGTTNAMSEVLLRVEDLRAFYGSAQVPPGVSLLAGQQSVAIVVATAWAKSTLCAAIMGFTPPHATGSVQFEGTS